MAPARKRTRHPAPRHAAPPVEEGPRIRWGLALGVALIAAAAILGVAIALVLRAPTDGSTRASFPSIAARVDGISCDNASPVYHEHAHLTILDRGRQVTVPANIGIRDACLYWMHTHDDSGEIHLETPGPTAFTLGDFFDIWHRPLSTHAVATARVSPGSRMRIYVNRQLFHGDPRSIPLRRHTLVMIEVGPPFSPPDTFDWQGD